MTEQTPTPRRWTICHYDEVLTVNKERTMHWTARSASVKSWREAFGWLARSADGPPCDRSIGPCHIDVVPVRHDRRAQDVAACLPSAKAAIDGLVDAGVWEDDSPEHVLSVTF